MGQNGGRRPGAGRPKGSKTKRTLAIEAAVRADLELTASRTLEEIRRLGFSDIGQCFDEAGRLKPLKDLPTEVRACIASVKVTKKNLTAGDGVMEDVVEIKLWDKIRALEMAAKYHGLLTERLDVTGKLTLEDLIVASRAES